MAFSLKGKIDDFLFYFNRKKKDISKIGYSTLLGAFRERDKVSSLLPWGLVSPGKEGTIFGRDFSFMATLTFRGRDMASATPEEILRYNAEFNKALKVFGTGSVVYFEAQRHYSSSYRESRMPTVLLQQFEEERKEYYEGKAHFETDYYLTLYYLPSKKSRILNEFIRSGNPKAEDKDKTLKTLRKEYDVFVDQVNLLGNSLYNLTNKTMRVLSPDEMITYLHSTVSAMPHFVKANYNQEVWSYLADSPLTGGTKPMLGEKHMRLVTVLSFPPVGSPGYLDIMNSLNMEFRWVSRFCCLNKEDAVDFTGDAADRWGQMKKSIVTMTRESITNTTSDKVDQNALIQEQDALQAGVEVQQDYVSLGRYTMTFVVLDDTVQGVEDKAGKIMQALNSRGFVAYKETFNSLEAWWGSIPGCWRANVRTPVVSSLNFCHLAPITATWSGDLDNRFLKGPVLLYTDTVGNSPFRLNIHVADKGHTMVVGPSGSGKSVLLNTLEAHFLKYPDSRIFIFDKAASSRALTLSVGGHFYNLAAEGSHELSFQPLARIDDENEKKWAKEWIKSYLEQQNLTVDSKVDNYVWEALQSLATMPPDQRTISVFCTMVQSEDIRLALKALTQKGSYGKLFDNDRDVSGKGRWQVFEMETLMGTPAIVPSTLDYLFHRIESTLKENAGPSIIVLDECWLFFDNPAFKNKLKEYFKDMRKKNTSIVFATQNLADIALKPDLMTTIMENCDSRIYLPNPNASNQQNRELYYSFGINDSQIDIISSMTPKQDYYYSSPKGDRVFQLALRKAEFPFVTATAKTDQIAMNQFIASQGSDFTTEKFIHYWFGYKDCPEEWEKYLQLKEALSREMASRPA